MKDIKKGKKAIGKLSNLDMGDRVDYARGLPSTLYIMWYGNGRKDSGDLNRRRMLGGIEIALQEVTVLGNRRRDILIEVLSGLRKKETYSPRDAELDISMLKKAGIPLEDSIIEGHCPEQVYGGGV